ncbi:MAG: SLC13 family permease [Hyphomicrobiaceae bacterium]|nr:SLC13 family permease [Hyphomicrobiaceae bacterium]
MFGLTVQQGAVIGIVSGMLILFMWERWRYDVVALCALCAALAAGVVPADKAFVGFSDQVVVVIASVLVISKAVARSGLLDRLARRSMKGVESPTLQVGVLSAAVGLMSALVKNVGTLGIFMPIAIQVARRCKRQPSIYLMPLAFASLIGGTITQIGTSPNLLISTVREDLGGEPFRLFDYAWVGLPLTVLAVGYLMVGWRLLPHDRTAAPSAEDAFSISDYATELVVPMGSPFVGKTVGDLEAAGDGEVVVTALERAGRHIQVPAARWPLMAGDILTLQAEPNTVEALVEEMKLELAHARALKADVAHRSELRPVEAVVSPDSPLVGSTPSELALRRRFDINLLAVSRAGTRRSTRLQSHRFQAGDVVVVQGWESTLQATLADLGLIPLADRGLTIGSRASGLIPLGILAVAMVLISLKAMTVAVGFFAAAVMVVLLRQIPLKEAYRAIEGPVIVMLAALIPIAQSFQTTGVTELIGNGIAMAASHLPGWAALTLMLAVAMVLTPFLNNAAAVLMLGPVAGVVARHLGYNADPFLMAVALGCACDFLTPVGHQNNLLVMGPGGYRFGDYWRLGLPLSLLVLCVGPALILLAWPLR